MGWCPVHRPGNETIDSCREINMASATVSSFAARLRQLQLDVCRLPSVQRRQMRALLRDALQLVESGTSSTRARPALRTSRSTSGMSHIHRCWPASVMPHNKLNRRFARALLGNVPPIRAHCAPLPHGTKTRGKAASRPTRARWCRPKLSWLSMIL